jgi:hypothetical protein
MGLSVALALLVLQLPFFYHDLSRLIRHAEGWRSHVGASIDESVAIWAL